LASASTLFNPSFDFENLNYDLSLSSGLGLPSLLSTHVDQLGLPSLPCVLTFEEPDHR
jgi:hypothetical protein